jgi:tetratricopeptide (TPR) repeat protein
MIFRKTELVLEFVYRLRNISPKTQITWFRSEDLFTTSDKEMSASATGIQLDTWLKPDHIRNSLVVVDPTDGFGQLLQVDKEDDTLLGKLKNFGGTVIVMARDAQSGRQLAGPHGLCEIGELDEEASATLLRGSLGPLAVGTPSELEEVTQLMAYLPRAILQVAKLITSAGMTVAQFLHLFKSSRTMKLRLFGKIDRYSDPEYRFSLTGNGVLNVRAFRSEFVEGSRILYQLHYLGGESVPLDLFSATDPLDMLIIMFILKGHFLVSEVDTTATYTLHPLVCLAMQSILDGVRPETDQEDIKKERIWFEQIVKTFSEWYPDAESEDRAWWRTCFTHLLGSCDLQINPIRLAIAKIHRKEASYFKQRGGYIDALRMTLLAKDVLSVGATAEHLGILQEQIVLLDILGRYSEVQAALQTYPVDEEEQIALWKKRMESRLELAEGTDRYDSALSNFKLLKESRTSTSSLRSDTLQSMDDYGMVLMLKGRYQEASIQCRSALAGRTTTLGISHPDTLSSLDHLAIILHLQGLYSEALQYSHQAIRTSELLLGLFHPSTLLFNLTKSEILLSAAVTTTEFDDIEALLVDSSNRLAAVLGENHPRIMTARCERALIMQKRGKYEAAEQMNRATLCSRSEGPWSNSERHSDTLTSKHQLAEIIYSREGAKSADALSEEVLLARTEVLTNETIEGDDFHPDQLRSLQLRAKILLDLGNHELALEKINLVLTARLIFLGAAHLDVYTAQSTKAEILRLNLPTDPGKKFQLLAEIELLHRHALQGLTQLFGSQHHATLTCLAYLALAKGETREGAVEAAELLGIAYEGWKNAVGEFHPECLKVRGRLADANGRIGRWELGKEGWRGVVGGWAKTEGVGSWSYKEACRGYEDYLKRYEAVEMGAGAGKMVRKGGE